MIEMGKASKIEAHDVFSVLESLARVSQGVIPELPPMNNTSELETEQETLKVVKSNKHFIPTSSGFRRYERASVRQEKTGRPHQCIRFDRLLYGR